MPICPGERNTAETLLFDTRQSGQLAVKRLDSGRLPLLQLTMPMNDPVDPLPEGLTPHSPLVKVPTHTHTCLRHAPCMVMHTNEQQCYTRPLGWRCRLIIFMCRAEKWH